MHQGFCEIELIEPIWQKKAELRKNSNKGLCSNEQYKFSKIFPPVGIELGTFCDPFWILPDSANLASVNWGIFNFTFAGAPID